MLVRVCPCVHNWRRDLWEGRRERRDLWEHQLTATGVGRQQSHRETRCWRRVPGSHIELSSEEQQVFGLRRQLGGFQRGCDGHGHVLIWVQVPTRACPTETSLTHSLARCS